MRTLRTAPTRRRGRTGLAAAAVLALATSCSLVGTGEDDPAAVESTDGGGATSEPGGEVVLLTHDSFALPDQVVADFEAETGIELTIRPGGDAGALTNRLVLSKDNPQGDAVFGIDNTFASRALEEGVLADTDDDAVAWPDGVEQYALPGDDEQRLAPVDNGNVCVNVDTSWFAENGIEEPESLDDLTDPAYEGLFVTPGAATSSPGLAFLLSTVAEYGEDWPTYWEDLVANGAQITSGWTDAYQGSFTQGGGKGQRPIVLSYDSSPAFTVAEGSDESSTRALLDTCFQQVEYAGVLEGAENPDGAAAVVAWLQSPEVQAALPESMYVFPVVDGVELPADWARFAERPTDPYEVDPAEVAANRDDWLREWTDVTTR
ncbi:thiamine ABC transporter substrate-binding protein [Nocardioides nanhaiensis]|uniref:Thiamine ABC transporter substrate-binding protein n=1 Tax=Nocardioides nanhaiensis TaxID=1476871 RepID=A0ABP8W905_9ACTN